MFFKASVGPGVHTARSDSRSLAFIEEYWRLPQQPTDPLCSEFKCVRLYSTTPKVYYVIDAWRILGPAPIMRNAVHPTIPFRTLPLSAQQRKREYPSATEDSKPGEGDGSPQWIVNMWAMMWGTKRPTPGEVDCDCLIFLIFFLIFLFLFLFIVIFLAIEFSYSFSCSCSLSCSFSVSFFFLCPLILLYPGIVISECVSLALSLSCLTDSFTRSCCMFRSRTCILRLLVVT